MWSEVEDAGVAGKRRQGWRTSWVIGVITVTIKAKEKTCEMIINDNNDTGLVQWRSRILCIKPCYNSTNVCGVEWIRK